jgi:hypothetical protein
VSYDADAGHDGIVKSLLGAAVLENSWRDAGSSKAAASEPVDGLVYRPCT